MKSICDAPKFSHPISEVLGDEATMSLERVSAPQSGGYPYGAFGAGQLPRCLTPLALIIRPDAPEGEFAKEAR
jgi:hypothetical protein